MKVIICFHRMFTDVTGRATTYFFSTKKYGCLHALVYNLQFPCSSPLSFFLSFLKKTMLSERAVQSEIIVCLYLFSAAGAQMCLWVRILSAQPDFTVSLFTFIL